MKSPRTTLFEQSYSLSMQHDVRFPGGLASDLHIMPAQVLPDSGSKRLRDRLFDRESRGQEGSRIFVPKRIRNLFGVQNPVHESLPKTFVGCLNACNLDD